MSILIKGMEMPTKEEIEKCIIVRHDGEVWIVEFDNLVDGGLVAWFPTNPMRAVPVPPHGRLIDADALLAEDKRLYDKYRGANGRDTLLDDSCHRAIQWAIEDAPTIIPAEEGER